MTGNRLRLTALVCILLQAMVPAVTAADVVVLKTGEKINGTVANRGILRSNPLMLTRISILVNEDAGDIRFYGLGEVDVVVLETGENREIIDIADILLRSQPLPDASPAEKVDATDESLGALGSTLVILLGVGVFMLGGANVFGSGASSDPDPLSYVLMAAGGILVIAGFASLVSRPDPSGVSAGISQSGSYLLTLDRRF